MWQTWNFCKSSCFYLSLCTSHWCQNQWKEVKMFRQKLYLKEINSWLNNSITWSYAAAVMCIITRKYQGAFCCSQNGAESLLNFIFSFKSEVGLYETRTAVIKHWRNFAGCHNFHNINRKNDIRLQTILCKLEKFGFSFIKNAW